MNTRLYTIKGRNLNVIRNARKSNKKIMVVENELQNSKNALVTQLRDSEYLTIEIFKKNDDIRNEIKRTMKNNDNIHYLKINGEKQNICKIEDHLI